ncbi:hypothetical protein HYW54_02945 [Candidatus Gottesmanbacteria bacterium]|nr:hypothetical protein [Candidatus Gottesmanbacteria bacterium]
MGKILIILIVALVVGIGWYGFSKKDTSPELQPTPTSSLVVDKTAKFAIYTNDTFRVFTASMYHNLSKDVFIQADSPNIVRVKKEGITWNDFFTTLPFKLTKDCLTTGTKETFCTNQKGSLKFYLNGDATPDLLNSEIQVGDKALITYGNENENQIKEQLNRLNE